MPTTVIIIEIRLKKRSSFLLKCHLNRAKYCGEEHKMSSGSVCPEICRRVRFEQMETPAAAVAAAPWYCADICWGGWRPVCCSCAGSVMIVGGSSYGDSSQRVISLSLG